MTTRPDYATSDLEDVMEDWIKALSDYIDQTPNMVLSIEWSNEGHGMMEDGTEYWHYSDHTGGS